MNERKLKESSAEFYQQTLDEYGLLVHTVRRQFEMLRPEGMSKVKRLLDGEETRPGRRSGVHGETAAPGTA